MKNVLILSFCLAVAFGANAQRGHVVTGSYIYHAPVYVYRPVYGVGYFSPFYSPFGFYGYPYFGYPYGTAYSRPSNLQIKEADIRADYQDRIYSVKQDSSLTGKQKRQEIRALKKERNQEIKEMVANYHKQPAKSSVSPGSSGSSGNSNSSGVTTSANNPDENKDSSQTDSSAGAGSSGNQGPANN